jgi:transposase
MEKTAFYQELLNLPNLEVSSVAMEGQKIVIECHIKSDVTDSLCPSCNKPSSCVHKRHVRVIRDLDISGREVWLHISTRQFVCRDCRRYFYESLSFADSHKSYTHRQADYVFLLAQKQSAVEVGCIVNMVAKSVERLVLNVCKKTVDLNKRFAQVRRIGIDEQSHRKGKKDYFCVITDIDRGIVLDMLPDRKMATIIAYFKKLGAAFCQQITEVCCDNWDAYITAAQMCFPNAKIILDRFHVTLQLNQGLDNLRKQLKKEDKNNPNFKGIKWILFKQYSTLSDKQLDALDAAINDNPRIGLLYHQREAFHHILDNAPSVEIALQRLIDWKIEVIKKGITEFDDFIKMLNNKQELVINYVTNRLSNAATEGLNNLIRSIRRVAFGMTNFQNLRWRVLAVSA